MSSGNNSNNHGGAEKAAAEKAAVERAAAEKAAVERAAAEKAAAEKAAVERAAVERAAAEKAAANGKGKFKVAPGCSITSRRGVLPPGASVDIADAKIIKSLYERKLIVKA